MAETPVKLILASASRYRRELLGRIVADFAAVATAIDETRQGQETPAELAMRLACAKAAAIAHSQREALVIGSDQVAALDNTALGKPGNHANAARQLAACSGRDVTFYTAVSVEHQDGQFSEQHLDVTTVTFRHLSETEINKYLERDKPWDCAGSFRSEGLGAVLFESIHSHDPHALIGLPLIWLAGSLRRAGLELL